MGRDMQSDALDRVLSVLGYLTRILVYFGLLLPAIIIILVSFTRGQSMDFPPDGFSLQWYENAFASRQFMGALWESLQLATLATIAVLIIGAAAAYGIVRYRFRGSALFQSIALSPMIIPVILLGLGLLQLFAWAGFARSSMMLFTGHLVIMLPYVVRTLITGLMLFDTRLEQAAQNLRAPPFRVFRKITLPLLVPSLITASIFAFVTSFGNVTLSSILAVSGTATLPVQMFTYVEYSNDPIVAAVSTLVIAITTALILIIEKVIGVDKLF